MGLETGTFINDLVVTNPLGTDNKSLGDDHLRLIKNTVKNTFPGMAGAAWRVQNKIAAYTVIASDNMTVLDCTVALTLSLTAVATLGNKFYCIIFADGVDVILDPSGVETVNSSATVTITNGVYGKLFCDGVKWFCELGSNVTGPAASTNLSLATWDGITGKKLKDGIVPGAANNIVQSDGTTFASVVNPALISASNLSDVASAATAINNLVAPGASGDLLTSDGTNWGSAAAASGPFTKSFTSADQVVTSGGTLTIAHGLGVLPTLVQSFLRNITAENSFVVGDVLPVSYNYDGGTRGLNIIIDATNIEVGLTTSTSLVTVWEKNGTAAAALTFANWVYFVRAWA